MSLDISRPIGDFLLESMAEAELRHKYPDMGGPRTGIASFDAAFSEALMPGSLIVVAGESGSCKTAFATQLAVAFGAQTDVLAFTLEDRARDVVKRAKANASREDVGDIRRGFAGKRGIPAGLYDAAEHLASLRIRYIDNISLAVEDVSRAIKGWVVANNVQGGVVIIDQLSHITPTNPDRQKFYEDMNFPVPPAYSAPETKVLQWQCRILKLVAQRLGVVIIILHQLNEAHGMNKPTMSSIRGSRGIVHEADMVMIPWIPKVVEPLVAINGAGKYEANVGQAGFLIGAKTRGVAPFELPIKFMGKWQVLVEPGAGEVSDYAAPAARTQKALEGFNALAALRSQFDADADAHMTAIMGGIPAARKTTEIAGPRIVELDSSGIPLPEEPADEAYAPADLAGF